MPALLSLLPYLDKLVPLDVLPQLDVLGWLGVLPQLDELVPLGVLPQLDVLGWLGVLPQLVTVWQLNGVLWRPLLLPLPLSVLPQLDLLTQLQLGMLLHLEVLLRRPAASGRAVAA